MIPAFFIELKVYLMSPIGNNLDNGDRWKNQRYDTSASGHLWIAIMANEVHNLLPVQLNMI